ncbi:hypothetical protein DFR26_1761 [Paraperlucidibaca baekdonensis]|uniref:Uncharacterized protein n=1 Tax=Paraperlucidibaca baekdonensis TaxID=748120 RepID=A0A3E0H421_9GAMM|nr:hypothetical protein [Paraperlucidibaca baekdonensis]REH37975.1 hypothetical protein DFR26_1761 [Paraperlucidibaca baekdonensis]
MITVYTSMIDTELNYTEITKRFDFIAIWPQDFGQESSNERLVDLITRLYRLKDRNFLAIAKDTYRSKRFVALVAKGQTINFTDDSVAVRALHGDDLPAPWLILSLLTNALPTQLIMNSQRPSPWFLATKLNYVVEHKTNKNGFSEIICCRVEPATCQGIGGQHIKPSSTTFSSREAHFFNDGLVRRAQNQPSFNLDNASQLLARQGAGAYINIPLYKGEKSRAPAYEVSAKSPESFQRTRLGTLAIFLNDFNQAYSDLAKITLKTFEAERTRLKKKTIDTSYLELMALLQGQTINLIDNSEDTTAASTLTDALEHRGYQVATNTQPTNGLNLHLIKPEAFYKKNKLPDPYQQLREQYPEAVIQSCTDESVHSGNKHIFDVALTELLVKWEIAQGRLIANYPSLPAELIFMTASKHPDKNKNSWIWFCSQVIEQEITLWIADQAETNLILSCATSGQFNRLQNSYRMPYVIYNSKTEQLMLLEDTQALSIPDHKSLACILNEIEQARKKTVPVALVHEFLNEHPLGQDLAETLQQLLATAIDGQLAATDVANVHHKSKAEIAFHQHLALHGHQLNTSLRGKDGPLGSVRDIWLVPDQGLYCTGSKDSPQQLTENFSHIYHLDTAGESFPDWFIPSLQVWHIRHRNATTIPYVFKHLHEFQRQQLASVEDDGNNA